MQNKSLGHVAAIMGLLAYAAVGISAGPNVIRQNHAQADEPYVQVTSVTVEPTTIHRDTKSNRATITVQIMLSGTAPAGSTVRVDVGTYSSHPPENKVSYLKQSKTAPVKEGLTTVDFTVEGNSQTMSGKVVIAAEIHDASKGLSIKEPDSYKNYRAELAIAVP